MNGIGGFIDWDKYGESGAGAGAGGWAGRAEHHFPAAWWSCKAKMCFGSKGL